MNYWIIINNSGRAFTFVAEGNEEVEIKVYNKEVWEQIKKLVK